MRADWNRRLIGSVAIAAACALALAGSALARGDANVSFDGIYHHGKPKKVVDFNYYGVPIACDETETSASSAAGMGPMKVKDRRFHGTFHEANGLVTKIKGKYAKDLSKVTGTIRVAGDDSDLSLHNCDSGKLRWVTN